MLIPRLITAFILIPATLAILYFSSPLVFMFLSALLVLHAAWEWSGLMELSESFTRWMYVLCMLAFLGVSLFIPTAIILYLSLGWWLIALGLLICFPKFSSWWGEGWFMRGLMGALVLMPFWLALNVIHSSPNGFYTLIFLLLIIWSADSAAYFVGRGWGKHKLAPLISPGKSWEGCAGAFISVLIIVPCLFTLFKIPHSWWLAGILLALITIFFSIVGDLLESMVKRIAGVKDSGNLLPGHGGILDRIDSLTAATPLFVLGAWWLNFAIQ